jgi:hypothetical protein
VLFGIQTPFNFSTPAVDVTMQQTSTGEGIGGGPGNSFFLAQSTGTDVKDNLFYFWVIVDRSSHSSAPYNSFSFNVTMKLDNPLHQQSYTTFDLFTQFDTSFPWVPPEVTPKIPGASFSYFTPADSESYALEVAQPEQSRMESTPAANAIVFAGSTTWYLWNLAENNKALDYFGMAVITNFEMLNRVENREIAIFTDGIFLGVGIPFATSSALELFRELRGRTIQVSMTNELKKTRTSKPSLNRKRIK